MQLKVFFSGGSLPYFVRIKAKENLFGCLFCYTNLLEKRVQVLLSEKELSKLPGDSLHIFKRSYINRYIERPIACPSFWNGK